MPGSAATVSVIVVSYNTRDLLRECLLTVTAELKQFANEVFVVDNRSRDGSAEMVKAEFPYVRLIQADVNLGFAAANNRALELAQGGYVVLLNSDAFPQKGALQRAVEHMEDEPDVGIGGARLVGNDGNPQPSARMFPSPLNDFLFTGLSARFPKSRLLGRPDRTWANDDEAADVDWVPGAFSIVRRSVFDEIGKFDERFFLYYEEIDLCRRVKRGGYRVRYWPDVMVVHLGGESSKTVNALALSSSGSQLVLWRMRSGFLYYRKHHGWAVLLAKRAEQSWHALRAVKQRVFRGAEEKASESTLAIQLLNQAWKDTQGGRTSPAQPW